MLRYPEMAILKLVGTAAALFLAGLLPWVDNYAHLFGFVAGFLLSYALLPFVTLGGEYDRGRKVRETGRFSQVAMLNTGIWA